MTFGAYNIKMYHYGGYYPPRKKQVFVKIVDYNTLEFGCQVLFSQIAFGTFSERVFVIDPQHTGGGKLFFGKYCGRVLTVAVFGKEIQSKERYAYGEC